MKAYRIGNTITINWTISQKNGEPFTLKPDSIELVAVAPHHTLVIDDFSIDGNVVTWIFKGADQKFLGTYSLTLVQNRGKVDMVTVDCCEAFVLVAWSCLAGGNDPVGVETESLEISSTVSATQVTLSPEIEAAISAAVEPKQDKTDNSLQTVNKTISGAINEVSSLIKRGYIYSGIANPTTDPGTPAAGIFYIAKQAGTYSNFGGVEIAVGDTYILSFDGTKWSCYRIGGYDYLYKTDIFDSTYAKSERLINNHYFDSIIDVYISPASVPDYSEDKKYGLYLAKNKSVQLYELDPLKYVISFTIESGSGIFKTYYTSDEESYVVVNTSLLDFNADLSISLENGVALSQRCFLNIRQEKLQDTLDTLDTTVVKHGEEIVSLQNEMLDKLGYDSYTKDVLPAEGENYFQPGETYSQIVCGYTYKNKTESLQLFNTIRCEVIAVDATVKIYKAGTDWLNTQGTAYLIKSLADDADLAYSQSINTGSKMEWITIKLNTLIQLEHNESIFVIFTSPGRSYVRCVDGGTGQEQSWGYPIIFSLDGQDNPISFGYQRFCCVPPELSLEVPYLTDNDIPEIVEQAVQEVQESISQDKSITIGVADKIYAVVGDTLQLFYKGIFNALNINDYELRVECSKGNMYPRYFQYTPTSSDIGETDIIFSLAEVVDASTLETKIVATKTSKLITVAAPSSPSSLTNVLCVGDSTIGNGQWPKEIARRLYGTSGSPESLNISNIKLVGRLTGQFQGADFGWEGTGGWTWNTYITQGVKATRFQVSGVTRLNAGDTYTAENGHKYLLAEINVTEGIGNIRCMDNWDNTVDEDPAESGILTKVSGTGDETITYSSYDIESYSPFYNNETQQIDFQPYADMYCDGHIDWIVVSLGINSIIGYTVDIDTIDNTVNQAKEFIRKYHEQFPTGKVGLCFIQIASQNGGFGYNYGASKTAWSKMYERKVFALNAVYQSLANEDEFKDYVCIVDCCSQLDADNIYPVASHPVNTRSTNKEEIGTNAVHFTQIGANQVADAIYRMFCANLMEYK